MPGPAGTVSGEVERWGEVPVEALVALLEATTRRLQTSIETLAMAEADYQRQFWTSWQHLPDGISVAAMNRACEEDCAALDEQRILARGITEALTAKRDGLVAALRVRS